MKKLIAFLVAIALVLPLIELPAFSAGLDPYNTILCSSFDEEISLHTRANFKVSSTQVSAIWSGDYLGFKALDFGSWGPTKVTFTSGAREGMATMIQLRLDAPDGKLIAEVPVTPINFQTGVANTVEINIPITGVHDLYVMPNTTTADLFSFCFYTEDPNKFTYNDYRVNRAYSNMSNDFTGHAANMLWQLGIMTGEEGSNLDTKIPVSRAEFADAIYGIYNKRNPGNLGAEPMSGKETKFSDVSAQSPYSAAIAYLTELGVINGATETEFRPDEYIKYIDAVTILVRMLGYKEIAEFEGGYPFAYQRMARKLGIYGSDIDNEDVLRRGSMAELLYNSLQAEYIEMVGITRPDSAIYDKKDGVLGSSQSVYNAVGIVEATEISSLTMPSSGMKRNEILIDGETYYMGKTDAISFLGLECEFFYELDDETGLKTLRAIARSSDSEMVEISSRRDEIKEISDKRIVYVPDGEEKEKEVKISQDDYVLYNGVAADSSIKTLANTDNFSGTIIVTEHTEGKQSIIINEYADYVIESIDYTTGKIFAQNNKGAVTVSDDDLTIIYDEAFEEVLFKQLKSGDVLTVYQSKNKGKKFNRIYLVTDSVSGTVTSIDKNDYYINGKAYKLSANCTHPVNLGQSGTFLLNLHGDIVKIKTDGDGAIALGLFMGYQSRNTGFEDETTIKLMTLEGSAKIFKTAKRMVIDGMEIESANALINGAGEWSGLSSLKAETAVRYRLNADGEIKLIDTPTESTNDGSYTNRLTLLNPDDTTLYSYYRSAEILYERTGKGAVKYILPQSATIFAFFGVDNREENCDIGTAYDIISGTGYQVSGQLYSTTGDELHRADLLVWNDSIEHLSYGSLFVFDTILEQAGKDGEIQKVLRGWCGGETVEYIVHEDATTSAVASDSDETKEQKKATFKNIINNLKTGDVLRFETKPSNTIRAGELWLLCDGEAKRTTSGDDVVPKLSKAERSYGTATNLNDHLCFGKIIEKHDNYIVVDTTATGGTTGVKTTEVVNISFGTIAEVFKRDDGVMKVKGGIATVNLNVGDAVLAHVKNGSTASIVVLDNVKL